MTALIARLGSIFGTVAAVCLASGAPVQLGNEVLAGSGFKVLQGKRVGLITNPSGVNRELVSTVDVLRSAKGVRLAALFGPEHGCMAMFRRETKFRVRRIDGQVYRCTHCTGRRKSPRLRCSGA